MLKKIPIKLALYSLLFLFSISFLFHILVISSIVPFSIVWGSRINSIQQMYVFESVSLFINLLMSIFVASRMQFIKINLSQRTYKIVFSAIFMLFLLNTIGNLFSNNQLEKIIFTPITLILSILSLRVFLENE